MSYEEMCENIATEAKLLTKKQLEEKIIMWLNNEELAIYAPVLEKEFKTRK